MKDHDYVGSNDFIGMCKIDFLTLATGPVRHEMSLWDGTKSSGRITFSCEMQQRSGVSIRLRNAHFSSDDGRVPTGNVALELLLRPQPGSEFKSSTPQSEPGRWRETRELRARVTLRDLIDKFLSVRVLCGGVEIYAGDYLLDVEMLMVHGRSGGGIPVTIPGHGGVITAELTAANMPMYAQMKDGVQVDDEFKDCQPLFHSLPTPATFRRPVATVTVGAAAAAAAVAASPSPSSSSPSSSYSLARFAAAAQAGVAQQTFAGNFGATAGAQPMPSGSNGLPPGWDEHIDPATGHVFYINTATGASQWERPGAPAPAPASAPAPGSGGNSGGGGLYPDMLQQPGTSGALPPGFREERDPQGRTYYVNVATGASQWERPGAPTPMPGGYPAPAPAPAPAPGGYPGGYPGYPPAPATAVPGGGGYPGYPGYPPRYY